MGVDCKFLNFGVNIEKALKLYGLKVNFLLKINYFKKKKNLKLSTMSSETEAKAWAWIPSASSPARGANTSFLSLSPRPPCPS
jgi:hypothetical protein